MTDKDNAQSAEKFSLIIEQMDSSSALNPLKLAQEYKMASTMQFAPDLTGHSLIICLGWLRGYLQGQILYREYQSMHIYLSLRLNFIVFQVAVKIMKGFPDSEAFNVRFHLAAPTIPCLIFYIVYFSGDFVEKSRFGRVSITPIYTLY